MLYNSIVTRDILVSRTLVAGQIKHAIKYGNYSVLFIHAGNMLVNSSIEYSISFS